MFLALVRYKDGNGDVFSDWSVDVTYAEAQEFINNFGWNQRRWEVVDSSIVKVLGCDAERAEYDKANQP